MASPEEPTTPAAKAAPTTPGGSTSTWARAKAASHQLILQAAMEDLENRAAKMEKQVHEYKVQLASKEDALSGKTAQVDQLTGDLEKANASLIDTKSKLSSKISECTTFEESAKLNGERVDRQAAESDALREEISRLNKSNQEYKEKVLEMEAQAKLGDSEVIPLRYQVQRLTSEMDSMTNHSKWLESELSSKNEQLAAFRASHASEVAQLRSELDGAVAEKETTAGQARNLEHQVEQMQGENKRLSTELRDTRRAATDEKLAMEQNQISSERLVSLQKEQLQRLQQRHDGVASQLEALQKLAKQAEQEGDQELQEREQALEAKAKKVLEDQAQDYQKHIGELKEQLQAAQLRCKQAEEGLLLTDVPTRKSTSTKPLALTAGGDGDEPLNLTDLHSRLAQAQDDIAAENLRRRKAEIQLSRITAEIEANAPVLVRQRQEYELAMERQQDYKRRLDESLAEVQSAREEASDMSIETTRLRKQNKELQEEVTELAKQVQTLLVSRSGGQGSDGSGQVPSSVAEMQNQNQQLLKEHRRLTATVAELKEKLNSDTLRRKVEDYERELATLTEHRKQQQSLVEGIVQQRDLYRALLSKQDTNLLGSQAEEVSALQIVKQQSERSKTLEGQKKQLETDLAKTRAELDSVVRDVEASKERLARYESLNGELTGTVDRLQLQLSSSKADVARSEADASFHRDKSARLEETLQRSRDEVSRVTASKNEMQRINADLQKTVSKANADAIQMESAVQQANVQLRLAETQAATAKASEQRLAEEAKQLRLENSRQGGLNETVLRLEASLSARSAAEADGLKADIASFKEKLAAESAARSAEKEKADGKISDQETRIKELEEQKEIAVKELLKNKKECLEATAELQKVTSKSKILESQLRLAKKKLGETGDDKDIEGDLSAKVASLTTELEAKRKEAETLKERVATFEKLAKDNETALSDLNKATSASKTSEAEEIQRLKSQLEVAESETVKRKELITELTNDLAKNRDERTQLAAELNQKIAMYRDEAEAHQKNAKAAEERYAALDLEVTGLKKDISTAENNYERELALHASARTELRAAREEAEAEIRLRKLADEQVASVQNELNAKLMQLEEEKLALEKKLSDSDQTLKETRAQNTLLHDQLDKIGDQVEKMQAGREAETSAETAAEGSPDDLQNMKKTVTDLREVVRFVRSENDMLQAQLDASRRTAERERAGTAVAKRSLDEAREELRVLQESLKGSGSGEGVSDAMKEKLASAQEQARLLKDSNTHLREEVSRLEQKSSTLESQIGVLKQSTQPSEKRQQDLELEKAALVAEKDSLLREVNDWKGRVQSLVSKFNQVDPEEHSKVLKEKELLEKEVADLKAKKVDAEAESKRIRTLASRASSQLQQNKNLVETHKKTISKLTAEKDALTKAQKDAVSSKEMGELKAKVTTLETERANEKIQLTGATEMNEKLRDRLRQFQKTIMELRKKESALNTQLKESQDTITKLKETPSPGAAPTEAKESKPSAGSQTTAGEGKALSEETEKTEPKQPFPETGDGAKTTEAAAPPKNTVVPKVPPGGFKFGPSPPEGEKAIVPRAKSPVPTKAPEAAKTEPSSTLASKKRAAEPATNESESKKVAKAEDKSDNTASGQKAEAEKKTEGAAAAQKSLMGRRNSGETKELSMKERLLEKKRKLMLAMQKKKEEEIRKQAEAKKEEDTPALKKAKTSEDPAPAGAKEDKKEEAKKTEPAQSTADTKKEEGEEGEEAEQGEIEDKSAGAKKAMEAAAAPLAAAPAPAVKNPFGTVASAPFGSGATGAAPAFGGASTAAPTFGQPSAFGSGTSATFGASSFGKKPEGTDLGGFGKKPEGATAGGFGKKPEGTAGGGFGSGSFMNIKPPGSSTAPPAFTFGTSGSITLPTPSSISPQASMFNAFSSNNPFNTGAGPGGVTPLPLFGAKKEKSDEAKEEGKGE